MNKQKFASDAKVALWYLRLNQANLSDMTGLSKATISRALLPNTGIDAQTFLKICKALKLDANYYHND